MDDKGKERGDGIQTCGLCRGERVMLRDGVWHACGVCRGSGKVFVDVLVLRDPSVEGPGAKSFSFSPAPDAYDGEQARAERVRAFERIANAVDNLVGPTSARDAWHRLRSALVYLPVPQMFACMGYVEEIALAARRHARPPENVAIPPRADSGGIPVHDAVMEALGDNAAGLDVATARKYPDLTAEDIRKAVHDLDIRVARCERRTPFDVGKTTLDLVERVKKIETSVGNLLKRRP